MMRPWWLGVPMAALMFLVAFLATCPGWAATYYVNDASTVGDVYCTAPGSDANSGTTPASPKLTVTNLLATYTLAPGDIVLIDTGVYSNYTVTVNAAGTPANPIVFQGSTNYAAGGTVFVRNNTAVNVWSLGGSQNLRLRDLVLRDGSSGVFSTGVNIELLRVSFLNNGRGVWFQGGANNFVRQCVFVNNGYGLSGYVNADQCVFWSNTTAAVHLYYSAQRSISNSVIVGGKAYTLFPEAADFNVYWNTELDGGAFPAARKLSDIQLSFPHSWHSIYADPQFADPNALDFHPRSMMGRYHVATGTWVTDTVHSVLIDFGDPTAPWADEPMPNGGRMNAGLYGNTWQASKSRTNAWLLAISYNDGGTLNQTGRLYWAWGNLAPTQTVRLEYSLNNGTTWLPIITNWPATNMPYVWNASAITSSAIALWRILLPNNTNVFDAIDSPFALRGLTPVRYYVNDTNLVGDVYTTAPGSPANDGLTPATPKDSIQGVLDAYDLRGDHVIYVDTGVYTGQTTTIGADDFGATNAYLVIQGSTNFAAGGTVLDRQSLSNDVLVLSGTRFIWLRDLEMRRGRYGVWAAGARDCLYENVVSRNNTIGFMGTATPDNQTFRRCVAAFNTTAGASGFGNKVLWDFCILHSNAVAFNMATPAQWSVSNSIIVGGQAFFAGQVPGGGDYNLFWSTVINTNIGNLAALQRVWGWWNSTYADPLFVDPSTNLNLHLRSVVGTWSNGVWVTFTNHSPAIDLADPLAPYALEPLPNGSNANLGIYGNTPFASKSRTNAWLLALTYNDGGTLNAIAGDCVYWRGGNLPSGATVRIELSLDAGKTWAVEASNILASVGRYCWSSNTPFPSSRFARWRVVLESQTNVFGATTLTNFSFQSGPYLYYVNDGSTEGDVYCTAPGSDSNTGTSPGSPMYSLRLLIQNHEIQANDIIFMDTGRYAYNADVLITPLDGGASNVPVRIWGSTNYLAGGTVIDRRGAGIGIYLNQAPFYDIRDLIITNASTAVRIENARGIQLRGVTARFNISAGAEVINSPDVLLERCIFANNSGDGLTVSGTGSTVAVFANVFWRNVGSGIRASAGRVAVSNSVLVAHAPRGFAYHAATATNIVGNYNNVLAETNGAAAYLGTLLRTLDTLGAWTTETGQERYSLEADPLFADPWNLDFHLKTDQRDSRWIPGVGWYPGFDEATSPLIDAGDPAAPFANEPAYNGNRINIGPHGNTPVASKRSTNSWIYAASLRQGGYVRGTSTLHWVVGGPATAHTVRIEFSPDGGQTWQTLATNIPARSELFVWNTLTVTNTPAGLWRVISENDPALTDRTTNFFAVRNAPLALYVNDASTIGDVFALGPGSPTNWQATAARPINSLRAVFELYDLEPGDVVFVDTGVYTNVADVVVRRRHNGTLTQPVVVVGSTNWAAGGAVLLRVGSLGYGVRFENAEHVVFSNVVFRGGRTGVYVADSAHVRLDRCSVWGCASNGVDVLSSSNITISRTAIYGNWGHGIRAHAASSLQCLQSVIWSNRAGAVEATVGSLLATNSVLHAYGSGTYVYRLISNAVVRADYNAVLARDGANVALDGFHVSKALSAWNLRTTNDLRSLTHDPLFANPGAGDFHPRSSAGRYDPLTGTFVFDATNSPLIDTGHPAWPFANETAPNGGRINIGLYGNDPRASRSRTNAWLLALSFNDGGSVRGTATVYFVAGGAATSHLVMVDFSPDAGLSWTNIATNVVGATGQFVWNTTRVRSSNRAVLRYRSQADPTVEARTENLFTVNNDPLVFYVNDTSTNGDVYCQGPGQAYYEGLSPEFPADSILTIFRRYDPQPGDRILVDSGTYVMSNVVTLGAASLSPLTNMVVIQGSTNPAVGTVLDFQNLPYGFLISETEGISLRHLRIRNARVGVSVQASSNCILEFIWLRNVGHGFEIKESADVELSRCAVVGATTAGVYNIRSTNTTWRNGVLWSNRVGIMSRAGPADPKAPENRIVVSNSIVAAFGPSSWAFDIGSGAIVSDYNVFHLTNGAMAGRLYGDVFDPIFENVSRWRDGTGQDLNSLTGDPLLADPENDDFHPLSVAGRFSPLTGSFVTTDLVTSIVIDAGPKGAPFGEETAPNGSRADIGMYGNHREASRSPTNSHLYVVSYGDGGAAAGSAVVLRWRARGAITNQWVRLDFSSNSGLTWQVIATGVWASAESYAWDSLSYTSTLFGFWRVVGLSAPFPSAQSAVPFALRNTNFLFFVNDASTAGDVYTTVPGSSTNTGRSPTSPKRSVQEILDSYDLDAGDVIYVDTGTYTGQFGVCEITQFDSSPWVTFQGLLIVGSTNRGAGGTVFDAAGAIAGIQVASASGIELRNLTVQNALTSAVRIAFVENANLRNLGAQGGILGIAVDGSRNVEVRNCWIADAGVGLRVSSATNIVCQSCVLWSNGTAVLVSSLPGARVRNWVAVSNSVLAAFGPGRMIYDGEVASIVSDYNNIYAVSGATVARRPAVPYAETVPTLARWITLYGQDVHSLTHPPLFAQDGVDFHLRSTAGRFSWTAMDFVLDATNSPLIDAGGPNDDFSQEPVPNGGRINIGMYGNTWEESKSPTNARLFVLSFNDGGTAYGTNLVLRWLAAGAATGHTVRIRFSGDAGATWTTLVSGISASVGEYTWDTSAQSSTLLGLWEVRSEIETNTFARNATYFALRNAPVRFYVNDSSTIGDVYSTAPGHTTNWGLFAYAPKRSIQEIVDAWDVEPGDIIYVDTGVYTSQVPIVIGQLDGGDYSNQVRVVIQGSTNRLAGGAVLHFMETTNGLVLNQAEAMEVRDLTIRGAAIAISLVQARRCLFEGITIEGGQVGFSIGSEDTTLRRCVVRGATSAAINNNASRVWLENCVLWSNRYAADVSQGPIYIRNSVIGAWGTNAAAYYGSDLRFVVSDFNAYYLEEGARAAVVPIAPYPTIYFSIARWMRATTNDLRSYVGDPLFADADAGDFHLKSQAGRYDPASGTWVIDPVTSPLIDAGDPSAAWTNEPPPNGRRINIDLYGNTAEASRTPTNAALTVLSYQDGGRAEGVVPLYWVARGAATGHVVRLQYSWDGGSTWTTIVSNLPAAAGVYYWDTTNYISSIRGVWAVESQVSPSVRATNRVYFALRNQPLQFYVDDESTNGNVYVSVPGNPNHTGTTPSDPLNSVQAVLDRWDLEPGDTIFMDTGQYFLSAPITWDRFDAWESTNFVLLAAGIETNRVVLQGSTNEAAGGTVLVPLGNHAAVELITAPGVGIRNIVIACSSVGLVATDSHYGLAEWVHTGGGDAGFYIERCVGFTLRRCVARNHAGAGISVVMSEGTHCEHSVIWSNRMGIWHYGGPNDRSSITLRNSIIGALGSETFGLFHISGRWTSDYNNVYAAGGAMVAGIQLGRSLSGRTNRIEALYYWSRQMDADWHSLTEDPKFADPARGDFHLKTTRPGGRYDPFRGIWTNDNEFSKLIDAGDPSSPWADEPAPNGARVNIGLYGGTWQASKTPTNGWLTILTYNDGGAIQGTQTLYWVAGGVATGHMVYLDFAHVSGIDMWTNIATNISASTGSYDWDSTGYGRAVAGEWRIVSSIDRSVSATSRVPMVLRDETGAIWYFVNDSSTNGDVYTTAPGRATYPGTTPYWPKSSLRDIISTYKLEPVDVVWIDTGYYPLTADIVIDDLDSGWGTNRVTIRGSTNWAAGGTVLDRQVAAGDTAVIRLQQASGVNLRDLILRGAAVGVQIQYSDDCTLEHVRAELNGRSGFDVRESGGIVLHRCIAWRNGTATSGVALASTKSSVTCSNVLFWGNASAVRFSEARWHRFRNSILQAVGGGQRVFYFDLMSSAASLDSDFNNLIISDGATIGEQVVLVGGNEIYGYLPDWQRATGLDQNSLSHDPLFADATNGVFRLRSVTGRFRLDGTLTNDTVTSPLIDVGDPLATWTNEPMPNGGRINLGPDGNTSVASLSLTNPWLLAVSYNAGGVAAGTVAVRWVSGNLAPTNLVRLEYTRDGGISWLLIASNVSATATGYAWNVSAEPPTILAKWRVIWQANTNVRDEVDNFFAIKNSSIRLYVNDGSTNGDVYCRAPGHPANSGLTNNAPLNDPALALARYPLGPGDIVYIDTGEYNLTTNLFLGELNRGLEGSPIIIQGSTNYRAGGSVLSRGHAFRNVFVIQNTRHVVVRDLRLTDGMVGLHIDNVQNATVVGVHSYKNRDGFMINTLQNGMFERCVSWSNRAWGISASGDGSAEWWLGVLWGNRAGGVLMDRLTIHLYESIIQGKGTSVLVRINEAAPRGDYNVYWREDQARLAFNARENFTYQDMQIWQRNTGADAHSALLDPLMNEPENGDFTLRSEVGRYSFTLGAFVQDSETSWAIDAGHPTNSFALEPAPNGGRRNVGPHGNTPWASKSVTNRALLVTTLNDGGIVSGTKELCWLSRGMTDADRVRLLYSPDNGLSWQVIASNVPARQSSFVWDTTTSQSSPLGLWRIELESNTNIADRTDRTFVLRNTPISFYVNDSSTVGDVYTTAVGSSTNDGLSPSRPLSSIAEVLRYDLEAGDTVFVDTGVYPLTAPIRLGSIHNGNATSYVQIVGSTNVLAGGTLLVGAYPAGQEDDAIVFEYAQFIELAHLQIRRARRGLFLGMGSGNNRFRNVVLASNEVGVVASVSAGNRFERVLVTKQRGMGITLSTSPNNTFESCVIWSNGGSAIAASLSSFALSNSILYAAGATNFCLDLGSNVTVYANYNVYFTTNDAPVVRDGPFIFEKMLTWSGTRGQDTHSIQADPLFADAANDDFHLRSVVGRFRPGFGWVSDPVHSPAIDLGAPESPYSQEPAPNGGRRNIGLYGGTPEASMSRTNAWLMAITAHSGGRIGGVFPLTWAGWLPAATNTVRLDYSYDMGNSWTNIAQNVLFTNFAYLWVSTNWPISPIARWKVTLESNTNVWDMCDDLFAVNGPFTFYVNDASTVGDVYCTAPGSETNFGLYPWMPMASLQAVLDFYDLEGGDAIWIDSGTYIITTNNPIVFRPADQGAPGLPVTVRGNTNALLTVMRGQWVGPPGTLASIQAGDLIFSDMVFWNGSVGLHGPRVYAHSLFFTNASLGLEGNATTVRTVNVHIGSLALRGQNLLLSGAAIRSGSLGISGTNVLVANVLVAGASNPAVAVAGDLVTVRNCTLVGSGTQLRKSGLGNVVIENNIFSVSGADRFCIEWVEGTIESDYNMFHVSGGAWIANRNGWWEKLLYWQRESGMDANSLAGDPQFANPAAGDYHLKSVGGRWTGTGWVIDTVHSPAIDAGNPATPVGAEPLPNGYRVNLGAYGGTSEASKSSPTPWLRVLTANDGGVLKGTNTIRWTSGMLSGSDLVCVQYSTNNFTNFINLACGIPATEGRFIWDTTLVPSSFRAWWRVIVETNPAIASQTELPFAVRNVPASFYVNDGSLVGDIYTTAVGNNANDGLAPSRPKATLQALLDEYDTEAGDIIYVDTGTYTNTTMLRVIWSRSGEPGYGDVTIQGSTNYAAGGTRIVPVLAGFGVGMDVKASHMAIRDLVFVRHHTGLLLETNRFCSAERMLFVSNHYGIINRGTIGATNRNIRFWNNNLADVWVLNTRTTLVEHCTFVGNSNYAVVLQGSVADALQNNIFYMTASGSVVYGAATATVRAAFIDYNVYHFEQPGWIFGPYTNLLEWQIAEGKDFRSAITNPLLANVAIGDFHLRSTAGRYVDGVGWVIDSVDSWALDKANPSSPYDREPTPHGYRANLGAYGNTVHASKGNDTPLVYVRTFNDGLYMRDTNAFTVYPLIWYMRNVPTNLLVAVQFSGDGGASWVTLSNNVPAYREYFLWNPTPYFNTYGGYWRVVGLNNTNYFDRNDQLMNIFFGEFAITRIYPHSGFVRIVWRGAWNQEYEVEYATNRVGSALIWTNAPTGPGTNQKARFVSTFGGDFTYEDVESTTAVRRSYRVIQR